MSVFEKGIATDNSGGDVKYLASYKEKKIEEVRRSEA